ncbi:MAG: divalent-cation tolerance protein CutA [Ignavibacteriae bacterium]|nr:divalent-cation tolerance protein CutA [Ignavibacteriota bacterium]MCB9217299.1 divalent-cation tolerance protein CutA [Ignavibacteria bacterium]
MEEGGNVTVLFTTVPDQETAVKIGEALVTESLAACCTIIPNVQSIYKWEGEVQHEAELLLMIKTTQVGYSELHDRLIELHPYGLPELLALPVPYGSEPYLEWIRESIR